MARPNLIRCRPAARLRQLLVIAGLGAASAAGAAETPYPFEGTWTQADHVCAPGVTRVRTYTAKEVASPRGRCTIRRVASGSGGFELQEDCRHERDPRITELIRMPSPDTLISRRQVVRLKITRPVRYVRCSVAAPDSAPAPAASRPAPAKPAVHPPEPRRTP